MSDLSWFSAKLQFVCLIESVGADRYMRSVYILRARDFSRALERAIEIGLGQEREYLNTFGQRVRWRLKEIISLDIILGDTLDGAEINAEFVPLSPGEELPFDTEFHPEKSEPNQTV